VKRIRICLTSWINAGILDNINYIGLGENHWESSSDGMNASPIKAVGQRQRQSNVVFRELPVNLRHWNEKGNNMSRIDEALKRATYLRNINENREEVHKPPETDLPEIKINILVISDDQRVFKMIDHLQPLLQAEIIAANDIVKGLEMFFDKRPVAVDKHELNYMASMMLNLCCRHC
jgi:hypothetical protein